MESPTSLFSVTSTSTSTATASCTPVTPGKDGYVPEWACNSSYNYDPSSAAAVIMGVAFGITFSSHIYQASAFKKWRVCWTLLIGALWEFASFSVRAAGTRRQQSTPLAFASQILVLLAPMWVNAFIYMVMGRMIYFFVPAQKIYGIRGIKIAAIFVWLNIVSFITQVVGGIMISPGSSPSTLQTGIHVYMGGIGFQEFCILIFTSIAIKFCFEVRNHERSMVGGSGNQILDGRPHNWRPLLWTLFAALVSITIRIIFRLVEFSAGIEQENNPIPFHEAYFYTLDALPMLIAIVLFNIVHPGHVLHGEGSEFLRGLTSKERKEARRVKKAEKQAAKEVKKAQKSGIKGGAMFVETETYV